MVRMVWVVSDYVANKVSEIDTNSSAIKFIFNEISHTSCTIQTESSDTIRYKSNGLSYEEGSMFSSSIGLLTTSDSC